MCFSFSGDVDVPKVNNSSFGEDGYWTSCCLFFLLIIKQIQINIGCWGHVEGWFGSKGRRACIMTLASSRCLAGCSEMTPEVPGRLHVADGFSSITVASVSLILKQLAPSDLHNHCCWSWWTLRQVREEPDVFWTNMHFWVTCFIAQVIQVDLLDNPPNGVTSLWVNMGSVLTDL